MSVEKIGLRKTRDHYVPLSRGGSNAKDNIRAACYRCNSMKADMMPDAWEQFMRDNMCWWWTDPKKLKWPNATPIVRAHHPFSTIKTARKKASAAELAAMTAEENAMRMEAYLKHQPTKERPIPVFHEASSFHKESGFYKSWKQWRAEQGLP